MTTKDERTKARATVARWLENPERSVTAAVGSAMMAEQWQSRDDVIAMDANPSNLSQIVATLRTAGYVVEEQQHLGGRVKAYRVEPSSARTPGPEGEDVRTHPTTMVMEHPPVGARVTVRAVALGPRGALVVHLADGNGNAWAATVTGVVTNGTA